MIDLPETASMAWVTCSCGRCQDRRIPLKMCVAWLRATQEWTMPAGTPFQTFRFRCGRIQIVTWGEVQALRERLVPFRKAS